MPQTKVKSRLHSNKHKPKIKKEPYKTQSNLPPNLQTFKQKSLSGDGFVDYKCFFIIYMSLEDFQLQKIFPFDISIVKRDYLKIYHQ